MARQRSRSGDVDAYLAALDEPKRATLQVLRETILELLPPVNQPLPRELVSRLLDVRLAEAGVRQPNA